MRNLLHQVVRKFPRIFISNKHFVETSLLPSSLKIIGLDHVNSLAFPHCTAAESHKLFFLLGPLRQSPSKTV